MESFKTVTGAVQTPITTLGEELGAETKEMLEKVAQSTPLQPSTMSKTTWIILSAGITLSVAYTVWRLWSRRNSDESLEGLS